MDGVEVATGLANAFKLPGADPPTVSDGAASVAGWFASGRGATMREGAADNATVSGVCLVSLSGTAGVGLDVFLSAFLPLSTASAAGLVEDVDDAGTAAPVFASDGFVAATGTAGAACTGAGETAAG